jgi:hypothetical protein
MEIYCIFPIGHLSSYRQAQMRRRNAMKLLERYFFWGFTAWQPEGSLDGSTSSLESLNKSRRRIAQGAWFMSWSYSFKPRAASAFPRYVTPP